MKLYYKGKYDLNPESLPHGNHKPGAVMFQEPKDSKTLSLLLTKISLIIIVVLGVIAIIRCKNYLTNSFWQILFGCVAPILIIFPHEILHAICFKENVYLYTNLAQGMLFVTGVESMSKSRYVFMSLLPNIVFGLVPYIIGLIFPNLIFFVVFGIISISMGAGDYYNIYNAITQMPKGAKTYLYQFNSYWYMP